MFIVHFFYPNGLCARMVGPFETAGEAKHHRDTVTSQINLVGHVLPLVCPQDDPDLPDVAQD